MLWGLCAPEPLAPVFSVLVGLSGPFTVLPMGRPVEADKKLGIISLPFCCPLEAWDRLSREAEAHKDERGRNITTHVRAFEYRAGVLTANWRSEKSAKIFVSSGLGFWTPSC